MDVSLLPTRRDSGPEFRGVFFCFSKTDTRALAKKGIATSQHTLSLGDTRREKRHAKFSDEHLSRLEECHGSGDGRCAHKEYFAFFRSILLDNPSKNA